MPWQSLGGITDRLVRFVVIKVKAIKQSDRACVALLAPASLDRYHAARQGQRGGAETGGVRKGGKPRVHIAANVSTLFLLLRTRTHLGCMVRPRPTLTAIRSWWWCGKRK